MSVSLVSANDNDTVDSNNFEIYVSNNDNPLPENATYVFSNIKEAVNGADDNSTIIICDGIYSGSFNTGLTINKNLTIKSLSNNVTIDGENKYQFFNVQSSGSLLLKDLKFINGFANLNSNQLGIFQNSGNLTMENIYFNKMTAFMGVVYNEGEFDIKNSNFTNCGASTLAQSIVNIGNCTISDSIILNGADSKIDVSVYNGGNIVVKNSNINSIVSNCDLDSDDVSVLTSIIENSKIQQLEFTNTTANISGSQISKNLVLKNSNAFLNNISLQKIQYAYSFSSFNSNVTAISSIFGGGINSPGSILNITYSVIIGGITGNGGKSQVYAPYNWWGNNNGPDITYVKYDVPNWVVMLFESSQSPIEVGTNASFTVSLNKIISNNIVKNLPNESLLPKRYVFFESESGYFMPDSGIINGEFTTYLINNTENSLVYANVDSQKSRLVIGNGSSDYALYVSPTLGNNIYGDGSYENPYQTIEFALNKALNGNIIYLMDGVYTYAYNADLSITKNITIIGLGAAVLKRDDNRNIFTISKTGNLLIKNVNFTILSDAYSNPLFIVSGGNLTIENSNFYKIQSTSIINGESGALIHINGCNFTDNFGSVSKGNSKFFVNNSLFENTVKYYTNSIYYDYNYLFTSTGLIEVYNSVFRKNEMGIVNMHPTIQYGSALLQLPIEYYEYSNESRYSFFKNTTFEANEFKNLLYPYTAFKMYNSYGTLYGLVDSCLFIENIGLKMELNEINASIFINNKNNAINAINVTNSYFERNSNLVQSGTAYTGDGILNAQNVINSTFILNKAAYGGALYNPKIVHYCVFLNNTAQYEGNDIFSYSGDVDYSSNWWADNQKPDSNKVYLFLGSLKLDNWIIMTLSENNNVINASLNTLIDENGITSPLNYIINQRWVYFSSEEGTVSPDNCKLNENVAFANLTYEELTHDFKVYAKIDNQLLDLSIRNNSTEILMKDASFYGKYNKYEFSLVNINGQKISNQTLRVEIISSDGKDVLSALTDENGLASINFPYPVGNYTVNVFYDGNGYFEKSNNSAKINVMIANTILNSYNHTYYGKNNDFYVILNDFNKIAIENKTIKFKITNSKGESKHFSSITDIYGRADVYLTLDAGRYYVESTFEGDGWYGNSSAYSVIDIFPVNSTIYLSNVTFYGVGNLYNITLKNQYGSLITGENINVVVSQGNLSDTFVLTTNENGVAQLAINYLPGTYNIKASYDGDYIYGSAYGEGIIVVEKVLTRVSGFYHVSIPLNGIYSVILTDMYGRKLVNESLSLNLYKGVLVKSYGAKTDGNGEAVFRIDLNEATYLATFDYGGSTWYESSTGAATIIVSNQTVLSDVELNGSDLVQYYGENKFFVISFNDPNAFSQYGKSILATISSDTITQTFNLVTDAFGQARVQIKLNPGIYNITYFYANNYYNIRGEASNSILVYKMPTNILASDVIVRKNEDKSLEISLRNINNNPIVNMPVNLELAGKKYNLTTNDEGIARLLIDLDVGTYTATFSFANENYLSSVGSAKILVTDSNKTATVLRGDDVDTFENQLINYSVLLLDELNNPISGFNINLNIFDISDNFIANYSSNTNSNGVVSFNFELEYGKYISYASFSGSSIYLESSTFNYINVEPENSNLTKTIISGSLSNKKQYNLFLIDENAQTLSNRELEVKLNNQSFYLLTDDGGKASFSLINIDGIVNIAVSYSGDKTYQKSSFSDSLVLAANSDYLFCEDLVKYYRNGTQFYVQLSDSLGNPIVGKNIIFVVNGDNFTNLTDENGWATLFVDFLPGQYDVECYYENATASAKITVLSTIIADNLVKVFKDGTDFVARVLDGRGMGIANTSVTMLLDSKFYVSLSDSEGYVSLKINNNPGYYNVTVQNPYDNLKESFNITVLPSSQLINTQITGALVNGSYVLTLLDVNNNSLANGRLSISINDNEYSILTDRNGQVIVDVGNNTGIYNIKAFFAGDGLYNSSSFKYPLIISSGKNHLLAFDVVKYYRNGTQFYARLTDENSNPLVNKSIYLTINGLNYTRQTNASGWIKFNINLNPGSYDMYCSYWNNNSDENAFNFTEITVLSTIDGNDLVKYYKNDSQFYVKLVDGKGNPLANSEVVMNINGVFYTRTTDDSGIARLNINLNPGKYVLTATNPNDGLMASFTITVLSTMYAENLVKYYRNDSQYYVKLVDGEGNPLTNSSVTININGVFYTRMTDDNGVARLNINLNPGEYIITATNYLGLSYSSKITVLPVLFGNDMTMNYMDGSRFKVSLLDGNGNINPNKEIQFNINGVFYNRITDDEGIAYLNINLMPGKYIISSTYDSFTISNNILIF